MDGRVPSNTTSPKHDSTEACVFFFTRRSITFDDACRLLAAWLHSHVCLWSWYIRRASQPYLDAARIALHGGFTPPPRRRSVPSPGDRVMVMEALGGMSR